MGFFIWRSIFGSAVAFIQHLNDMVEYGRGDELVTMLTKKSPESNSIIIYSTIFEGTPRLDMALIIEGFDYDHRTPS